MQACRWYGNMRIWGSVTVLEFASAKANGNRPLLSCSMFKTMWQLTSHKPTPD